jgi:hypothetical protein
MIPRSGMQYTADIARVGHQGDLFRTILEQLALNRPQLQALLFLLFHHDLILSRPVLSGNGEFPICGYALIIPSVAAHSRFHVSRLYDFEFDFTRRLFSSQ